MRRVEILELLESEELKILNTKRKPLSKMIRLKMAPFDNECYPYYGAAGIIDFISDYKLNGSYLLVAEDGTIYSKGNAPMVTRASGKIWVSNHAHILQSKEEDYLYYALLAEDISPYVTGAVQPKLSKGNLLKVELNWPDVEERTAIAEVLSSLDDKIELLQKQNETLEALAQTLFRQWFIEEADDSWEESTLNDVLSVKGGATPSTKSPEYWGGDIAWTSPRDITTLNGIHLFRTEKTLTPLGLSKVSSGLLPKGTLLMSSRAPVGVLAFSEIEVAVNQGYIAIADDKVLDKLFIYCWLKENIDIVHAYSNGSTFMEISKKSFKSIKCLIPPKSKHDNFVELISPLFEKIKLNEKSVLNLSQTRDTLLPKLMSGQVRVKLD